uniref:Adenylate kinase 9 n=1 Tax=Catharus ustulatus TaxID=91951 RepID=A0A8C3U4C0_CATUS
MASQEEKQAQPFTDIFDEDEAEISFLLSKPTCFIVFGKPGSGKKTLARKLAQRWNCIFIEGKHMLFLEHFFGFTICQELLCQGETVPEELVTEMILQKIESPEVDHFGYVLTGFPFLSEKCMTVPQQIEKIMNLKLKPDILINIKCPDYELCQRISGQRQNPDSGEIYQRSQWDPKVIDKRKKDQDEEEGEEEGEDQDEEEDEEEEVDVKSESFHQLVHRPEDFLENAEKRIGIYKDIMLSPLEVRKSKVIWLYKNYTCNYCCFNKQDELFRALSSCKLIAPRYRWRRSRWGQVCPVALKEGEILMGNPEFAVSFLGKMYVLSSAEALKKFVLNPRPYLLPPMPASPCKVFVFGPPFSGRTTICNLIAHNYKGKVLDMDELIQQYKESRQKTTEELQKDLMQANKDRFPGASKTGGWVVDNYPLSEDHWSALSEKGLLPDTVVCLKDTQKDGACILRRAYLASRNESNSKVLERPTDEALERKEDDDGIPDTEEMKTIKAKIDLFMKDWKKVESEIKESSQVRVVLLEIAEQTPESLLNQTVQVMEKPFKYYGWELSVEDLEEEAQDLAAEEENEEEEDEEEETIKQKKRHMGDTKHFCPVSLKENFVLYPGLQEHAAKYKEKIYYFSTSENRDKFLKNPEEYVAHSEPLQAPPLRVCLLGIHGAGKSTCARQIADKLGIFHIQFEEYLQELILPKTKRKVGPSLDEDNEDDYKIPEELEDFSQTITETEKEKTKQEVELTDEEEAIKANLVYNMELPPEVLDKIVPDWWKKEPFRSTGFILDGFPRTVDEARYLSEQGLYPDVAVYIQVEEDDILVRLLPPCLKKWKDRRRKKREYKKKLKELKAKKRALANKDNDEDTEEDEEDEDIEAILAEEFLEEEEDEEPEEEENEQDAVERMESEISEKFESEVERLQSVQEELERLLITRVEINGGRKPRVVCYQIYSKLKSLVENRRSIFEKCYPITFPLAQKMLVFSYKLLSSFGQWDPVKLSQGDVIKPQQRQGSAVFPVIHRQYIYFFSSKENKEAFMTNPIKYICQPKPKLSMPVKIAIVGLPKSGKTTVAQRLASAYGFLHLSLGDAIQFVINNQPESQLALQVQSHLLQGLTVPDELAIQALDVALKTISLFLFVCRVVIDGYPLTRNHVNLLESTKIIPVKIFELAMDTKEVFRRALLDKESRSRPSYPEHDSPQILAIKNSCYKQHINDIRTYYMKEHQNWCVIDANHSKWKVWNTILQEVQAVVKKIQIYLERRKEGKAASIADLCITPKELQNHLGECGQYCPVSLAEKGELIDCSVTPSLEFAAEFQGCYYRMASQEELEKFLSRPEVYVSSLASHPLPPLHMLPKKLTATEVKDLLPVKAEMQGYCPVTYLDGKQRYEALVPGNIEYAAKYQEKVYIFESEEKLQKFMRLPEKYWNLKLPHKLPPKKEPMLLTTLPLPGYLEQGLATSLIKALHEVGSLKPKFPFLSVKETALLFVSFHLKAHNPLSSEPVRQMYRKKLLQFVEHCQLIPYLGTVMKGPYKEPRDRPLGFDDRLQTFLSLKGTRPTSV